MSSEIVNLWPARVVSPEGQAWGDTNDRHRAFLYTREDGTHRLVVLNAMGQIITRTDVTGWQFNGTGVDIEAPDGLWQVVVVAGCSTCGGSASASRAFEMLRGQGEEDPVA